MLLTEKRLRAVIQGILLEGPYEEDKMKLSSMVQSLPPHTGNPDTSPERCFDLLTNDRNRVRWVKWLAKHFLNVSSPAAGDSLEDALPSLSGYSKILQGVKDRYSSDAPKNEPFKKAIDNLLKGRNPTEFENLTLREIDAIKSLYEPKFISDASWKADKIGQFGTWALYFPTSQKNSINIAGFDPVTGESYVTWCTARTGGSNLFNLYAAQGMMLFYVINESPRSNPRDPESRISIGFSNGILEATGRENGITVNGANKGLTLKDLSHIFGSNLLGVNLNSRPMPDDDVDDDQLIRVEVSAYEHSAFRITGGILGKAHEHVALHAGTHPIVSEVKAAGSDVEKFDQMMKGLSTSEASDLASYILGHATEAVFRRAAAHKSDKVKGVVARFSEAPRDVLEALYRYAKDKGDKDMTREFLRNTSVPDILVDMLENFSSDARVVKAILMNQGLPADARNKALNELIDKGELFSHRFLGNILSFINDKEMYPDTMQRIWDGADAMTQVDWVFHFTNHLNTPSRVLYDISRASPLDAVVCARVVSSPNADELTIREIGNRARTRPAFLWDSRGAVARALVDNDLTPVEVLKYIADADVDDRYIHIKTSAKNKLNARSLQVTESRRMALRIIVELKKARL